MSTLQVTTITTVNNTTPLILQTGNTGGGQLVLQSANNDIQFVGNMKFSNTSLTGDLSFTGNVAVGANVTNFSSTGKNAKFAIDSGGLNLDDGYFMAWGGGTGRTSITGNKNNGTLVLAAAANNSGYMTFATNTAERMRITSDGRVGIGTTSPTYPLVVSKNGYQGLEVSVDGTADAPVLISYNRANGAYSRVTVAAANIYFLTGSASVSERMVIGSTGVQSIQFAPTQVASADANTLDDYEEGTWTPAVDCSTTSPTLTYSIQSGKYTKIGRLVVAKFDVRWSALSAVGSGNLWITGLPFASDGQYDGGVISEKYGVTLPASTYSCQVETFAGLSRLYITAHVTTSGSSAVLTSANLTTGQGGYLIGTVTYIV